MVKDPFTARQALCNPLEKRSAIRSRSTPPSEGRGIVEPHHTRDEIDELHAFGR
jgi:hypothetical protein